MGQEEKNNNMNEDFFDKKENNSLEKRGKSVYKELKSRNRYFYIYNRYGIIFGTILTILLIFVISIFIFFLNQNVPPRYIPADSEMRYFSPVPLTIHDKSDADIETFVMMTLKDLYSYDYINYNSQLYKSQEKFTTQGWNDFATNLNKSFILQQVKENQWISSYKTEGVPKIVKKGVDNKKGVAYWLVETEGVMSFYGQRPRTDRVISKLKIERVSTLEKVEGISIDFLVTTISK